MEEQEESGVGVTLVTVDCHTHIRFQRNGKEPLEWQCQNCALWKHGMSLRGKGFSFDEIRSGGGAVDGASWVPSLLVRKSSMSNVDTLVDTLSPMLSPSLFKDPAMSPRSPRLPRFTFENQAMAPTVLRDYRERRTAPLSGVAENLKQPPVSENLRLNGRYSCQIP